MRTVTIEIAEHFEPDADGVFFTLVEHETLHIFGGHDEHNYFDLPGWYPSREEAEVARVSFSKMYEA